MGSPRDDVRTVIVVGSRARPTFPADEWSDLDVAFTTTRLARYLAGTAWLDEIGDPWCAFVDPTGVTRHVVFAGGVEAGIGPLSHRSARALVFALRLRSRHPRLRRMLGRRIRQLLDAPVDEVLEYVERGAKVVVDKDGLGAELVGMLPVDRAAVPMPTPAAFRATVGEFWFVAMWNAKHLRRGELWAAMTKGCDGRMKELLLTMIEWRERASRGARYDTWDHGRHLEEWADADAVRRLHDTFAHYDEDDLWRASFATMELFHDLAVETADRLGLEYPQDVDDRLAGWVLRCGSERRDRSC